MRGAKRKPNKWQRPNTVGEAGGVGIVFFDSQVRFMVKQSIEHVGCVAHRRVNDFGVEGRVAVRDMRVESNPGPLP